jgi:hypothetical protein
MAIPKTAAALKAEMKAGGYRLPHGYDIVKRKPRTVKKKATATAKKTVKRKSTVKSKSKTAKQSAAQKRFATNAKRAAQMVRVGKATDTKAAWKQIKMEF